MKSHIFGPEKFLTALNRTGIAILIIAMPVLSSECHLDPLSPNSYLEKNVLFPIIKQIVLSGTLGRVKYSAQYAS